MATSIKPIDYRTKVPVLQPPLTFRSGAIFQVKRTVILMFLFIALTFVSALGYVDQQIRLRKLNYEIIALKQKKQQLVEDHKTLQLQLDQSKRLDKIEEEMRRRGFIPVEEQQIHLVH